MTASDERPWEAWLARSAPPADEIGTSVELPTVEEIDDDAPADTPRIPMISAPGEHFWAPTVVCGPAGGGGATTVAVLAAAEIAECIPTVLIDTDPGGDLTYRARPADAPEAIPWQQWYSAGARLTACEDDKATAGVCGAVVLGHDSTRPDYLSPLTFAVESAVAQHYCPVLDIGKTVGNAALEQLWPTVGSVLVCIADSPVQANRSRGILTMLAARGLIEHTTVVVTEQRPRGNGVYEALHSRLAGKVGAVLRVPFDAHLATGAPVNAASLSPVTLGRNRIARSAGTGREAWRA